MKLNSLSKNQKALIALMVCAGYMTVQPMTAMADDSVASVQAVQQKQSVSGVVKDATGEPVIGASIVEKGTTNVIERIEFKIDIAFVNDFDF